LVTACLRWLPFWLPASDHPAVIALHMSGFTDRSSPVPGPSRPTVRPTPRPTAPSQTWRTDEAVRERFAKLLRVVSGTDSWPCSSCSQRTGGMCSWRAGSATRIGATCWTGNYRLPG